MNTIQWIITIFATLLSVFSVLWATIACRLKPKLKIEELILDNLNGKPFLKVKILNQNKCYNAIYVNIEMCLVENTYTYHFKIDRSFFLIIPHNKNKTGVSNYRYFKAVELDDLTKETYWKANSFDSFVNEKVKNENTRIRVRVYATHEFSGFGKAEEQFFQYRKRFFPVKNNE